MRVSIVVLALSAAALPAMSLPLSDDIYARDFDDFLLARADAQAEDGSEAFSLGTLWKGAKLADHLFSGSDNNKNNNKNHRREVNDLLAPEPFLPHGPGRFWGGLGPEIPSHRAPENIKRELYEILARADAQEDSEAISLGTLWKDAKLAGHLFDGNSHKNKNQQQRREDFDLLTHSPVRIGVVERPWANVIHKRELNEMLARDDVIGELLARQAQGEDGSEAFSLGTLWKGAKLADHLFSGSSHNNDKKKNRREFYEREYIDGLY